MFIGSTTNLMGIYKTYNYIILKEKKTLPENTYYLKFS
jgi:hypothetical protein